VKNRASYLPLLEPLRRLAIPALTITEEDGRAIARWQAARPRTGLKLLYVVIVGKPFPPLKRGVMVVIRSVHLRQFHYSSRLMAAAVLTWLADGYARAGSFPRLPCENTRWVPSVLPPVPSFVRHTRDA